MTVESELTRQIRLREERVQQDMAIAAAEAERGRLARAERDLVALLDRQANPHRGASALTWLPAVPPVGGRCEGCGANLRASDRAGHAVERAAQGRPRCYRWCLGLPA